MHSEADRTNSKFSRVDSATASTSEDKKPIDEVSNKQPIDEPLLSSPVDPTRVEPDVETVIPSAEQPIRRSTRIKLKPTQLNDFFQYQFE